MMPSVPNRERRRKGADRHDDEEGRGRENPHVVLGRLSVRTWFTKTLPVT